MWSKLSRQLCGEHLSVSTMVSPSSVFPCVLCRAAEQSSWTGAGCLFPFYLFAIVIYTGIGLFARPSLGTWLFSWVEFLGVEFLEQSAHTTVESFAPRC